MNALGIDRAAWMDDAACRGLDPELFFAEGTGGGKMTAKEARAVCQRCVVRAECLEYALDRREKFGMWGGLSERERRRLLKIRKQEAA